MSHNVLYMRGQVAELRGNFDEARRWYEEALSISPTHVKSMQRLVSLGLGWDPPTPRLVFPLEAVGDS
jgi:tetratricopeptide (TPR) repeat protein